MAEKSYLERMDAILDSERREKGLVGIKFGCLPSSDCSEERLERMARSFCVLNEMEESGLLAKASFHTL